MAEEMTPSRDDYSDFVEEDGDDDRQRRTGATRARRSNREEAAK